ncbi:hypothetical protein [Bacillus thuringiensis]|uniref:hypothetical protein n=1 Tax=Bacillus thuringiensis TaxID=1428 RepID=UPI0015E0B8C3|nr:hypothetical protein [Bacillus thuringiensis]
MIEENVGIMREYIKKTNAYLTSVQEEVWNMYRNERYSKSLTEMMERSLSTVDTITMDIKYSRIMYRDIEQLPQLFYSSFVLTLYAFIENELYELCMYYCGNYTKEEDPPSSKSYYKIKNYITETMKIKIDKKNYDELKTCIRQLRYQIAYKFEELKGIRQLRHQIAHKGPAFDRKFPEYQKDKRLREMIKHIQKHNLLATGSTYTYI